jgi:hypothetical protein
MYILSTIMPRTTLYHHAVTNTLSTFSCFTLITVALLCLLSVLWQHGRCMSIRWWNPASRASHCSYLSVEASLTSSVLLIAHHNKIFRLPYLFIRKTLRFMFFCICMKFFPQLNQHYCSHARPCPWYAIQSIKNCIPSYPRILSYFFFIGKNSKVSQ